MQNHEKLFLNHCFYALAALLAFFYSIYPLLLKWAASLSAAGQFSQEWNTALSIYPMNFLILAAVLYCTFRYAEVGTPFHLPGFRRFPVPMLWNRILPLLLFVFVFILILNHAMKQLLDLLKINLPEQNVVALFKKGSPLTIMLITFSCLFIAPLTEELTFRHVFFRYFLQYMPEWTAALLSSVLFALMHCNIRNFLPLMVLGLFLQTAYKKTGSLAASCLMHFAFNFINLLVLFSQLY